MSKFEETLRKFHEHTAHLTTNRQMRAWIQRNPEETRVMLRQFLELTLEAVKEENEKEQK